MRSPNAWEADAIDLVAERLSESVDRQPDFEGENRALFELATQVSDEPSTVLTRLAELVTELCPAHSAGVSILGAESDEPQLIRWPVIAGAWQDHAGASMPRDQSPCDPVIEFGAMLILREPESRFAAIVGLGPKIAEIALAPLYLRGSAVGALWAVAQESDRLFDAEDIRLLGRLASFVSLRIFAPSLRAVAPTTARGDAEAALGSLTRRQREILDSVLLGHSNKTIAIALGISKRTIENHRAAIMRKMGVSSIPALVQMVMSA